MSFISTSSSAMPFLFFIALPLILIYLFKKSKNSARNDVVPPGPPRLPLIGNLHHFGAGSGNLPLYLWRLSQKYGPIIHLKLGSVPLIVISSAKLAEEVLKTQDLAFCSRPNNLIWQQKLTYNYMDMVFAPYGDYWREVRKITAVHLFSSKKVQSFRSIREDEVSRMITKIGSFSHASSDVEVVNLSEMTMTLGISLICRIAFGKRYDEHGPEMRRFQKLLDEANDLMGTLFVSDYLPSFSWVDKLTGSINLLDKTFKNLDLFYQELIDEHLDPKRVKKVKEEEKDILDVLIQLKEEESCSIDFNWDQIKALLTDIFLAGTDTSAASTVWMMTALIKAPKVMKKLQEEIRNLVGRKGKVDEDDIPHLPYLKAVVNETFRLYPSVRILVPRETTTRCTLEGYQIQPKTLVWVNAWAIARDPESWENPYEFSPDRFLKSDIDVKGRDFRLIPFGSGRRICPGMHMGLANVELALANLLYSFDWELPRGIRAEDIDTDPLPGITMHKKNPLLVVAKKFTLD